MAVVFLTRRPGDPARRAKYAAVPAVIDGVRFDSQKEARRYHELTILARLGAIDALTVHPRYPLLVNEVEVGTYVGDFRYRVRATGATILEDVKSPATRTKLYRLKRRLVAAIYGIDIVEI
jgi:hypothetical protein